MGEKLPRKRTYTKNMTLHLRVCLGKCCEVVMHRLTLLFFSLCVSAVEVSTLCGRHSQIGVGGRGSSSGTRSRHCTLNGICFSFPFLHEDLWGSDPHRTPSPATQTPFQSEMLEALFKGGRFTHYKGSFKVSLSKNKDCSDMVEIPKNEV